MNNPTAQEVAALWTTTHARFVTSRNRIHAARMWLAHRVDPDVPAEFMANADIKVKLPHAVTTSLHTVSVMGRKRPLLKRMPMGAGMQPQKNATQVAQWCNGALTEIEKQGGSIWKPLVGNLFNQGECGVLCYPAKAHWEQFPDVDGRGKGAYNSYLTDWKSTRIPIVVRVVPPEQCLPIMGPGMRLDALLIRSEYTEDSLRLKGYSWYGDTVGTDNHPGPGRSQGDSTSSLTRVCTLMELWQPGSVTYYVGPPTGGVYTYTNFATPKAVGGRQVWTDQGPAAIDLGAEFGLNDLLGTYAYGMNFAEEEDPDKRGVPFLWPFMDSLKAMNNFATAHAAYTWRWAFEGPLIQPDKDTPPELLMEDGHPRTIKLNPMAATVVPGTVASALNLQAGPDVDKMINMLMGSWQGEGPNTQAFGGAGATSGNDRSLIRAHLEDSFGSVLGDADDYSGALGAWRWLGQTVLAVGTAIANTDLGPVPVFTSDLADDGYRRKTVELTKDMAGGTFDLEAFYPPAEGENLPYAQLLAEWWLQGAIPHRMFLEKGIGDNAPEQTEVEIASEQWLFKTPQGQAMLGQMVAEELGGEREKQAYQLQQQGRMLPDGTPAAAAQGLPPQGAQTQMLPPGGQGVLPGTAPPSMVASATGGMIAGGIGSGPAMQNAQAVMQQGMPPP